MKSKRIIWTEIRDEDGNKEMFFLLAEKGRSKWVFFERSSWELRWYPITSTGRLVKRALIESSNHPQQVPNKGLSMRQVA